MLIPGFEAPHLNDSPEGLVLLDTTDLASLDLLLRERKAQHEEAEVCLLLPKSKGGDSEAQ